MMKDTMSKFNIKNRVAIITGGAGLLGIQHARAIADAGGIPILWDINDGKCSNAASMIANDYGVSSFGMPVDITNYDNIMDSFNNVLNKSADVAIYDK